LVLDTAEPGRLYAGTYGYGVYVSTDYGESWEEDNVGLTCNKVLSLALRSGPGRTIFAGTEGGAVFRSTAPTGVSSAQDIARPLLLTVCPNPCRNQTLVSFPAPFAGRTMLSLHDAVGRVVSSSVPPTSPVLLNTKVIGKGTYFLRVVSGGEARVVRLTVLD
ncbi:MAG: T9SS type A sorting domain-containing protein, partial [candidate division WOR-3 bacterium]